MKKPTPRNLFFLLLLFVLSFAACTDEDIDDLFGDPVEKFLGTWRCEEQGSISGGGWNYEVRIRRNPSNSSEIQIENFNLQGFNERATALVTGNSFTIPSQRICDNTLEISGSGSFSNNQINLTYSTNDSATLENFTARYYKP
ncbi:MAG: hypothetical protein ACK4VN_12125 [Bacteroidales bacterium]